jgi:uncharacterized protein YkwD
MEPGEFPPPGSIFYNPRADNMVKKLIIAILFPIFVTACISITKYPDASVPQQDFVTATLEPAAARWIPTVLIVPTETTTPSLAVTTSASEICTKSAILLRDVTIPDNTQLKAGETFTKTWEFQNIGTCSWSNYTVKFASGDEINAPLSTAMHATAPNERVQVSMELTAPAADGSYTGNFALYDSNGEIVQIGTEKSFWVKFIVGAPALVSAASGSIPVPPGNCTYGPNANYVSQIISLINTERANAGLPALTADPEIAAFAQSHAEDMAFNNFLSHDGSDGSFGERMMHYQQTHPAYGALGEILAIGTPQNAMDQWRKDEHWDFVLSSTTLIGVGYAYNSCSDYGGYFTVDFGE